MAFSFVGVDAFTPNTQFWSTVGNTSVTPDPNGRDFVFTFGPRSLVLQVLGPRAYRLRFNPAPGASYAGEISVAVASRDLGLTGLTVAVTQTASQLTLDTGRMRIVVGLTPFSISVFRGTQLIHRDFPGAGVLYIPNEEVIAVLKTAPPGALYLGCGEKAGAQLYKNQFTYTFFNFDNFSYAGDAGRGTSVTFGNQGGPLNPTEPLYCSIPVLMESNPFPSGDFAGAPYANGVFLDNTAQSFINVSADVPSGTDMSGRYYLGALYSELDYYFFAGDGVGDVLEQYTTLTGRAPMPPRYAFGLHQGAYGYYDRYKLAQAANAYRAARIPCDGLHIDVDFQDNYRTFTHSEVKFPNVAQLFSDLHTIGFKMSTNITPIIKAPTDGINLGEDGQPETYKQGVALETAGALIFDTRASGGESPNLYQGGVNYGDNKGSNPYSSAYPPLRITPENKIPLTAPGYYPDFGLAKTRQVWGQQYDHLLNDVGLDMIWQDMTCPAINPNISGDNEDFKTFPQNLMMAQEVTLPNGTVQVNYLPNAKLHNSYVGNLLRATWDGINALRPATRNFIIARGGYAGMQRYAGLWTGDSASTWDFLRINVPEVLNLGLSGVPISGCDIGGFAKIIVDGINTSFPDTYIDGTPFVAASVMGGVTNYELLTRWMQLGSFLPWYRNHYDGYNKQFQEPYAYGEPVPTNCRRYVELRYRMLQVYYDAMYRWTQTGLPIARPLFLSFPQDSGAYAHASDEFLVGDDFLVAPILDPHESINPPTQPLRDIYLPTLPEGTDWYAFMDNKAPIAGSVAGGTTVTNYFAGLDLVPIYVRAGAILPFCDLEQWVGELPANPLTFNCYPGPDRATDATAYQLYEDDGVTTAAQTSGVFRLSRIYQETLHPGGGGVTRQIRVAHVQGTYTPPATFYYIAIIGSLNPPGNVTRDGTALPDVGDPGGLDAAGADAWYWNSVVEITFAKIFDNRATTTVAFNF